MKSKTLVLFAALLSLTACGSHKTGNDSLIVYYSQNGTTRTVAECLAGNVNADVVELECSVPYPDDFQATIEESRDECQNSTGRALVEESFDLTGYDTIYVGYPIWFGTFAPPIVTFLKENDLSGKNVVLFCTYGSGGRLASEKAFREMCPDANVLGSYGIAARQIGNAADEVASFIDGIRHPSDIRVGAFSEQRELTEDDLAVFAKATAEYGYLNLEPVSVSTQVVAGLNYCFVCRSVGSDGNASDCNVLVFKPLSGEPYLKSVER